jgi:hypothetical protein
MLQEISPDVEVNVNDTRIPKLQQKFSNMKRPVTEEVILCFLAIHKALQLFGPILEVDLSGHSLEDCNTHGSIALNGVVEDVGAKKKILSDFLIPSDINQTSKNAVFSLPHNFEVHLGSLQIAAKTDTLAYLNGLAIEREKKCCYDSSHGGKDMFGLKVLRRNAF